MRLGLSLMPDFEWLDLLGPLAASDCVDYFVVTPETLWRTTDTDAFAPNAYHDRIRELVRETGKPVVGHGVGYSVGTARGVPGDDQRRARWRSMLATEAERFGFEWYTEHHGATWLGGEHLALPLPVPQSPEVAALIRERALELRCAASRVGLENSAFYFALGDPLEEPEFLRQCLDHPDLFLLLDVHNLWANALNLGFDARDWLDRLDPSLVEEVHVSGGAWSDPAWFAQGEPVSPRRLDSHDESVPEPVWDLLESVLQRCPRLRGVTFERMEGTVTAAQVPGVEGELDRLRALCERSGR